MNKKINKFIYWIPRILAIIFILFLTMFSLDIFEGNYGFWGTVLGLFMHNIPSFVLMATLAISWKHELVGAIIFGLVGIGGIIGTIIAMFITPEGSLFNPMFPILGVIPLTIGTLFLAGWFKKRKISRAA